MTQQEPNYPQWEVRAANLKAACWENDKVGQNGNQYVQKSFNFQKSYKDPATGNWVNKGFTVFPNEILALLILTLKAAEYCLLVETGEDAQQSAASE